MVGGAVDGRFTALPGGRRQDLVDVLGYRGLSEFQKGRALLFLLATALPSKMEHAFQMVGLGEQVDQVHLLDAISGAEQASQITRSGCRIAGDVGYTVRSQSDKALDHTSPQTASWRVHHHKLGLQLTGSAPQEIYGRGPNCLHIIR